MENELIHHGIKGMKWGVRRFQNEDGTLTPAGKKRYAESEQSLNSKKIAYKQAKKDYNKSFNKAYNRAIAAYSPIKKHREANDERWVDVTNKADRLAKTKAEYKQAKQELKGTKSTDKSKKRKQAAKTAAAKTVVKGAEVASKLLLASAVDDIFYGGAGKKIVKEATIQTGRAAVTAFEMARGGYDIKWFDKQGRRVG